MEKGLLDGFLDAMVRSSFNRTVKLFKSESNQIIVGLVVEKKKWAKTLQVAFRLYGRVDAADREVTLVTPSPSLSLLREKGKNSRRRILIPRADVI
jgi:hypothetical protein